MPWMPAYADLDEDQVSFVENSFPNTTSNFWLQGFAGSGKTVMMVHTLYDQCKKAEREGRPLKACVVVFTNALGEMVKTGLRELERSGGRLSTSVPIVTFESFHKPWPRVDPLPQYDVIFCDEVQDLTPGQIQHLLDRVKEKNGRIVVAGDPNQSLYKNGFYPFQQEETVRPSEIPKLLSARTEVFRKNYRLSYQLVSIAKQFFDQAGLGAPEGHNTDIRLYKFTSDEQEAQWVWENALDAVQNGNASDGNSAASILLPVGNYKDASRGGDLIAFCNYVLMLHNQDPWIRVMTKYGNGPETPDWNHLNRYLEARGVPLVYIGKNSKGDLQQAEANSKVLIMTYHSAKGLDFSSVYLPWLKSDAYIPVLKDDSEDAVFGVALTRCRGQLTLTYSGGLFDKVQRFQGQCRRFAVDASGSISLTHAPVAAPIPATRPTPRPFISSDADNDLPF
jgi:AAA domain/UvrD-like helicase C-terminal domain